MLTRFSIPQACPKCGLPVVMPSGPLNASVGVLGERPGDEEKARQLPFVGESGRVLRAELARLSLSLDVMRVSNLWLHEPNEQESDWHLRQAITTLKKCRVVLLLGSECAETFLNGKKVSNVTGLRLTSDLLPSVLLIPALNPASLLKRGSVVGEFRLALEIFKREIDKDVHKQRSRVNRKRNPQRAKKIY